jgi:hypothetical protein
MPESEPKKEPTIFEEIFDEIKPSALFDGILPDPPSPKKVFLAPFKKIFGDMKKKED